MARVATVDRLSPEQFNKWSVAYHEAGHAIAAVALGAELLAADIFRYVDCEWGGRVRYGRIDEKFFDLVVIFAGPCAEEIFTCGDSDITNWGGDSDQAERLNFSTQDMLAARNFADQILALNRDILDVLARKLALERVSPSDPVLRYVRQHHMIKDDDMFRQDAHETVDQEEMKTLSVRLPKSYWKWVRIQAIKDGMAIQEYVRRMIHDDMVVAKQIEDEKARELAG